jgi:hypothetical protein
MKKAISIRWDILGAQLAAGSDEDQAEFFKGFIQELDTWDSQYQREMQMHSIAANMREYDKAALSKTLPCIWFKEEK